VLSPQSLLSAFFIFLQYRRYGLADFITKRSIQIDKESIKGIEKLQGPVTAFRIFYHTSNTQCVLYFFNSKTFNTTDRVNYKEISLGEFLKRSTD
jgi:hypothetical protein